LGVAYQIDRKTVIRGGVGVVYNSTSNQTGSTTNTASANTPAFGQIVGRLQDGIPSDVSITWPTLTANAGQAVGSVVGSPTWLDRNAGRPMRLVQWNATLQREVGRDLVLEAGYVANRGIWEDAAGLTTPNAMSVAALNGLGFKDFSSASDAAFLQATIGNLNTSQKQTALAHGIGLPYGNFPTNQKVLQSLLPYPQYTGLISPVGAAQGYSWYDSLQAKMTKRFSHGLTFNANYTYAKTLSLTSSPDPFNRQLGKNLSAFDLPHQFRFTAQYQVQRIHSELPVLRDKVVAYALSGWGTGWALSYQSAFLVGLPTSTGTTPISQFLGYGPGPAQLMTGANPWSVDWNDYSGKHHTDPLDINCHCFDPTKTIVLNPNVWQNVPNGQFAANEGSLRWFRGMRSPVEDANFGRDFRVRERVSLNVRVEFTNIFNRTIYPGISLGSNGQNFSNQPVKFNSGPNVGLYSSGFGTINPTAGTNGQRSGSFVARLTV